MEIMTKLFEENHIDLPYFSRGWERKQGSGNPEHALSPWVKPISIFSISDRFVYVSPYDISEPEASIPSLEQTLVISSKLPPKTSHFSLAFDVPSENLPKSIHIFPFMILKMICRLIYIL